MKTALMMLAVSGLAGCATLVNDAMVPISFSFSDGSSGRCSLENKRGKWLLDVPGVASVRRSDDPLRYVCDSDTGTSASGGIPSTMGAEIAMSAVFFDLGITDAITDKHRYYPASYIVPVAGSSVVSDARSVGWAKKERFGAQVREVADSMMCTAGARMTESTAESEKWELDCGDGESLQVRCFDDACYVK